MSNKIWKSKQAKYFPGNRPDLGHIPGIWFQPGIHWNLARAFSFLLDLQGHSTQRHPLSATGGTLPSSCHICRGFPSTAFTRGHQMLCWPLQLEILPSQHLSQVHLPACLTVLSSGTYEWPEDKWHWGSRRRFRGPEQGSGQWPVAIGKVWVEIQRLVEIWFS